MNFELTCVFLFLWGIITGFPVIAFCLFAIGFPECLLGIPFLLFSLWVFYYIITYTEIEA